MFQTVVRTREKCSARHCSLNYRIREKKKKYKTMITNINLYTQIENDIRTVTKLSRRKKWLVFCGQRYQHKSSTVIKCIRTVLNIRKAPGPCRVVGSIEHNKRRNTRSSHNRYVFIPMKILNLHIPQLPQHIVNFFKWDLDFLFALCSRRMDLVKIKKNL
jgi:hypothetical protein